MKLFPITGGAPGSFGHASCCPSRHVSERRPVMRNTYPYCPNPTGGLTKPWLGLLVEGLTKIRVYKQRCQQGDFQTYARKIISLWREKAGSIRPEHKFVLNDFMVSPVSGQLPRSLASRGDRQPYFTAVVSGVKHSNPSPPKDGEVGCSISFCITGLQAPSFRVRWYWRICLIQFYYCSPFL